MDFLDRKSAPINDEEWRSLEDAVTTISRRMLIGRRIIELLGPLGAGLYAIPYSTFSNGLGAGMDMGGEREDVMIAPVKQQDVDVGSLQSTRRRNAGKPAANDHYALLPGSRFCLCRFFLRKGFGQNCAQWCTR